MSRYLRDPEDLQLMAKAGETLVKRRRACALTQKELAKRIEIGTTSVANIEQGRQMLTLRTITKICKILGITPNELLNWETPS